MVAPERRVVGDGVEDCETRGGAEGHGVGDGAIELDHRARRHLGEHVVERRDAPPVGLLGLAGPGVAGGNGGLQHIGAGADQALGFVEGGEAAADQHLVPQGAILLEQQHRLAIGAGAGAQA